LLDTLKVVPLCRLGEINNPPGFSGPAPALLGFDETIDGFCEQERKLWTDTGWYGYDHAGAVLGAHNYHSRLAHLALIYGRTFLISDQLMLSAKFSIKSGQQLMLAISQEIARTPIIISSRCGGIGCSTTSAAILNGKSVQPRGNCRVKV
jgi:hypothetical protein